MTSKPNPRSAISSGRRLVAINAASARSDIILQIRTTRPGLFEAFKMPWSRAFNDPIPLPRGRHLVTLNHAAEYIQKRPKAEQLLDEWRAAVNQMPASRSASDSILEIASLCSKICSSSLNRAPSSTAP